MRKVEGASGGSGRPFFRYQGTLYRLLLAWILASFIPHMRTKRVFTEKEFFSDSSLVIVLAFTLLFWLVCLRIRDEGVVTVMLLCAATLYCTMAVTQKADVFFAFGCAIFLGAVVMFSPLEEVSLRWGRRGLGITLLVLLMVYTLWVGGVCCLVYLQHWTPNFDFGIFAQMFYYLKKTGLPFVTSERDRLLSHFAVHISPICYLLLPLYALFPDPLTLMIAQAFLVVSGILPLALLCRRHGVSRTGTALLCGIYATYPAFIGGCLYYFHENNFLAPLLLWMFLAFEVRNPLWMVATTVLVCMVKEDAAMYAGVLVLYFFLLQLRERGMAREAGKAEAGELEPGEMQQPEESQKMQSLWFRIPWYLRDVKPWIFLGCILLFVGEISWLSRYGSGAMTSRYNNYIYDGSGSLRVLFQAILQNPIYVLSECFSDEKLLTTFEVLLPLGFLPILVEGWEELTLLIPYILMNLMSSYYYQHVLGYQYFFGSGAFLFYLAARNYGRLSKGPGALSKRLLVWGLCSSMVLTICLYQGKLLDYYPNFRRHGEERDSIRQVLALIPEDASVVSSTFFLPELSQRDVIYELYYTKHSAEYVVIDLRANANKDFYAQYAGGGDYELVTEIPGRIALFKLREGIILINENDVIEGLPYPG